MNQSLSLSALDLSPVPSGSTAGEALANTVDLAVRAERLGTTRYWLAEHHNTAMLASSSPELMIAQVAAATTAMRVGSGGIMLPNHSALKVAETFRTLETLHPGRIDLGIGRAPGTDPLTALALRRSRQALGADDFGGQLGELLGFLAGESVEDHPFAKVTAIPGGTPPPDLWMLSSSGYGAQAAAHLGFGLAFAHHINPEPAVEVLSAYRAGFRPSPERADPSSILAVSAICADTDAEAEELAATADLVLLRFAQGAPRGPLPSVAGARDHRYGAREEATRLATRSRMFVGGAERVAEAVAALAEAGGAEEVMVTSLVHDHDARAPSYDLLGRALGVMPREPVAVTAG